VQSGASLILNGTTLQLGEETTAGYTRAGSVWSNHLMNAGSRLVTRIFGSFWKMVAGTPRLGSLNCRVVNSTLNTEGGNAYVISDTGANSTTELTRVNVQDSRIVQQNSIANSNDIRGYCASNSAAVVTGITPITFRNLVLDAGQLAPITAGYLFLNTTSPLTFVNHSPFTLSQLVNLVTGGAGSRESVLSFEFTPRFIVINESTGQVFAIQGASVTLKPYGSTRGTIDPTLSYITDVNGRINGGLPVQLITEDTLQRGTPFLAPFTLNVNTWVIEVVWQGGTYKGAFIIRKEFVGDILVNNGSLLAGGLLE
jgi:hypothetical protein